MNAPDNLEADQALRDANRRTAAVNVIVSHFGTDTVRGHLLLQALVSKRKIPVNARVLGILTTDEVCELAALHKAAAAERAAKCSMAPGPDDGSEP